MPRRGTREWVRRGLGIVVVCGLALTVAGCGSASDPSPPTGVDMLVIPTPSPDPDDFVAEIDNPWLPYQPGAEWVYERESALPRSAIVTVTVAEEPATVAGLSATVVHTGVADDEMRLEDTDYYAQDRDGNVWWIGREGEWEAGVDGAQAGLAMAANPREGDGYRLALLPGVVEDRARVVSVDGEVSVPAGTYENVVEIETKTPLAPGVRVQHSYAEGVGLVQVASLEGPLVLQELVSGP